MSTAKFIGTIFLIFIALVGLNVLANAAGSFLVSHRFGFGPQPFGYDAGPGSAYALKAIHFDIFDNGGTGYGYITQGYGHTPYSYMYPDDWHDGIDIAADYGAVIYSPAGAVVLATGNQDNYCYHRGFGMYVALYDPAHNVILWFAHLGNVIVSPGEKVAKDAPIGAIGATGLETGTHLHFSIFAGTGFSMAGVPGCGPGPTASDRDLNPLSYLGTVYQ